MTDEQNAALVALLRELDDLGYDFTTVTPNTHALILARRAGEVARDLRDVFGWSMAFEDGLLPSPLPGLLEEAGQLARDGDQLRSRVRVSSLAGRLFVHSAYPTEGKASVFFGPDTHRFLRFVEGALADVDDVPRLLDVGAGCGPGGILAAEMVAAGEAVLLDSNELALAFARVNAMGAGVEVTTVVGESLDAVAGDFDLILANPPYMMDEGGRTYRDGGGTLGAEKSLRWAGEGARRLAPGGQMLLYTGSAIVGGEDRLLGALAEAADEAGCTLRYEELDPDIFGEELEQPAYAEAGVERIAAVGAVIRKG